MGRLAAVSLGQYQNGGHRLNKFQMTAKSTPKPQNRFLSGL
jgi:hypothetical protein